MVKGRRDNGDGSLYHRESDNRWVGSFYHDGERKYVYGSVGGKREEAKQKLKEAMQQAEQGMLVASNAQTVSDYLEYWLSVKKLAIKDSTHLHYAAHLRARIIPVIGKIRLQRLTTAQIQGCINQMVLDQMKPNSIRLIIIVLSEALSDAVKWKLISVNPCKGAVVPRKEREELQVLTLEQAQQLLTAARETDFSCLITLALATGLRRGELLSLKWSDVDFEKGVIRVQRTLVFINGEGYKEVSPKTKAGKRSITLPAFALLALKEHRKQQLAQRLQSLVFSSANGEYMSFSTLHYQFRLLLERAGLPAIRFHDLRHSCASFLLHMKVPPKVVQEILGHSSIVITMDIYGHVLPGMQEDAMQEYDTFISSGDEPQKEAQ